MVIKVWYAKDMDPKWGLVESRVVTLSKGAFKRLYKRLPVQFGEGYTKDRVFKELNIGNTLSTGTMQTWLRAHGVRHTSMSVGDILRVGSTYYMCIGVGWAKIEWGNKSGGGKYVITSANLVGC